MKKIWKKYNVLIIAALFIVLFVALSFLIKDDGKEKEYIKPNLEEYTISETVSAWANESEEEKFVLTVLASSTCYYCQEFNPVFNQVVTDYNLTNHWFELDMLELEDDYTIVTEYYNIAKKFTGTPFTMLTYDGELVDTLGGYVDASSFEEFLKDNDVID